MGKRERSNVSVEKSVKTDTWVPVSKLHVGLCFFFFFHITWSWQVHKIILYPSSVIQNCFTILKNNPLHFTPCPPPWVSGRWSQSTADLTCWQDRAMIVLLWTCDSSLVRKKKKNQIKISPVTFYKIPDQFSLKLSVTTIRNVWETVTPSSSLRRPGDQM